MQQLNPATCASVGLDCQTCTRNAALSTARLCGHLSAALIESSFYRLFREPGCASALPQFTQAYFEATEPAGFPGQISRMATVAAA